MYKALIISANSYRDKSILALPNTLRDAESVHNIFTAPPTLFDPSEVQIFSGNQVRANTLRTVINDFFSNVQTDDVVFFFWAGHGALISNEGYLITFDTIVTEVERTSITMNEIKTLIDNCDARAVFAWFDCCHAGAVTRALRDFQGWMSRGLEVNGAGKIIIAACTDLQSAFENASAGHGDFTLHLLNGLRGASANEQGEIDALLLYNYIANELAKTGRQTPVLKCTLNGNVILHLTEGRAQTGVVVNKQNDLTKVADSQNWCLLGERAFEFDKINSTSNQIVIEVDDPPQVVEEYLLHLMKQLKDGFWPQSMIDCVFGNSLYIVRVVDVSQVINNSIKIFKIILDKMPGNNETTMEASVGISAGVTISADEIAEIRARRILLGEKRHSDFSRSEWHSLNMFVSGVGGSAERIDTPPVPVLLNKCSDMDINKWQCVRLELIRLLIKSNCVENVVKLVLRVQGDEITEVDFEGVRRKQYTNVDPKRIKINEKYKGE